MHRRKESANDSQFTCPNSSCGIVFQKPIKVKNLNPEDSECYDACPRCLTAISTESSSENVPVVEANLSEPVEDAKELEVASSIEERKVKPSSTIQCTHHMGYLSERSKKEEIPEECMVCENIVKCMLKRMNG
jgi:hypothetical protein